MEKCEIVEGKAVGACCIHISAHIQSIFKP